MAENFSLYLAFSEFLKDEFQTLRKTILREKTDDYQRFRRTVVDLVLSTDIASPERTQINKSKWKEAFGDPYETLERKMKLASMQNNQSSVEGLRNSLNGSMAGSRRFSLTGKVVAPRRSSAMSAMSGVSFLGGTSLADIGGDLDVGEYTGEDESLSDTPETSENNGEDDLDYNRVSRSPVNMYGKMTTSNVTARSNNPAPVAGTYSRSASIQFANNNSLPHSNVRRQFERRASAAATSVAGSVNTAKYRQRLGILRTVDLSGETIETYSRRGSMTSNVSHTPTAGASVANNNVVSSISGGTPLPSLSVEPAPAGSVRQENSIGIINVFNPNANLTSSSNQGLGNPETDPAADMPDELKASVVMETIMTAADVAHNLQGWDHMVKWSSNLYLELRRAHVTKRGNDPSERWFENQIGFLESYLLPLARRLEDTGVFNENEIGLMFSTTVESNRDKWLTDGYDVAKQSIEDGLAKFPNTSSS